MAAKGHGVRIAADKTETLLTVISGGIKYGRPGMIEAARHAQIAIVLEHQSHTIIQLTRVRSHDTMEIFSGDEHQTAAHVDDSLSTAARRLASAFGDPRVSGRNDDRRDIDAIQRRCRKCRCHY